MKNKKLLSRGALSGLLLVTLFLGGCSSSQTQEGASVSANNNPSSSVRRPDFGQPDREPDVRGLVKSITGNEVTILKIDMVNRTGRASSTISSDEDNSVPAVASLATGGQGTGRGLGMSGGRPPGEMDSDSRSKMLEELKAMSTGEEKILIPVGIQMLKSGVNSETKEREMIEASLADIIAEKNITIWLNQEVKDRQVAEFVFVN